MVNIDIPVKDYNTLLQRTGLKDSDVLCCYVIGSRAYGNATQSSDVDLMLVCNSTALKEWSNFDWYKERGSYPGRNLCAFHPKPTP